MITANQININTSPPDLRSFLKFTNPDQFQLLNLKQTQILQIALWDAYEIQEANQRSLDIVKKMLSKRLTQIYQSRKLDKILGQQPKNKCYEFIYGKGIQKNIIFILALFLILVLIEKQSTVKRTIVEYQYHAGRQIGTITTEQTIPSGWTWFWLGIIGVFITLLTVLIFFDCLYGYDYKEQYQKNIISQKKEKSN